MANKTIRICCGLASEQSIVAPVSEFTIYSSVGAFDSLYFPLLSSTTADAMARDRHTSPAKRVRSSLALDAAALLSPTKTKDTQDSHLLHFKNFVKCLADQQPRCPRVCSHKASRKQLQYLRENSDDGRYFVTVQDVRVLYEMSDALT